MNNNVKTIKNLTLDNERALYGITQAQITQCTFDGPLDGESALKESNDITVLDCDFRLRYPFWHVENAYIENCRMTQGCRAALWYGKKVIVKKCSINGVKAARECNDVTIDQCNISSAEFGWMTHDLKITDTALESEYPFLHSSDLYIDNLTLKGKYSFQYVKNVTIRNSYLDTKDAFWHSENVTVSDSVIKGEYLGWYSKDLTLIRCKIIGTQPLCYADNIVIQDCEMIGCDLAFENSDVTAQINGYIQSVKNPRSGKISADSIEVIIQDHDNKTNTKCQISVSKKNNDRIIRNDLIHITMRNISDENFVRI